MTDPSIQHSATDGNVDSGYEGTLMRLATANEGMIPFLESRIATSQEVAQEQRSNNDGSQHHNRLALLPKQIFTILDPFLALPGGVTDQEQSRIKVCEFTPAFLFPKTLTQVTVLTLGTTWFGLTDHSRYSPIIVNAVPIALHSAVGRQWICIVTDQTLGSLRGEQQPSQMLVRQKRKAYLDLNEAMHARKTRFEEAMLAMFIVGLDQGLFGNERLRNLHSTATDRLLRSQGPLKKALTAMPSTEPFFVAMQFAIGKCHFPSRHQFDSVKESWKADLLATLRAFKPLCPATNIAWQDADRPSESCQELQARMIKLSVEVGNTSQPPHPVAQGLLLSLLLELAWTILQFADSTEIMTYYFRRLDFLTTGMFIDGGSGHPAYDLRSSAVGPAFSSARREVISSWCPAELLNSDAEIMGIQINALKMFQYLEPEGCGLVLERLAMWLMRGLPDKGCSLLTEAEMAGLEEQVVRTWTTANKNASQLW